VRVFGLPNLLSQGEHAPVVERKKKGADRRGRRAGALSMRPRDALVPKKGGKENKKERGRGRCPRKGTMIKTQKGDRSTRFGGGSAYIHCSCSYEERSLLVKKEDVPKKGEYTKLPSTWNSPRGREGFQFRSHEGSVRFLASSGVSYDVRIVQRKEEKGGNETQGRKNRVLEERTHPPRKKTPTMRGERWGRTQKCLGGFARGG